MVMPQIVLNAPGLDVSLDTIIHPACPGAPTGSIILNVTGQNPVFDWSDSQISGPTATDLVAGIYSVTITDGGCVQVLSNLEVTAPPPIEINLNALDLVQCFGHSNGLIDLAVFGATPPYSFLWSNDSTSEDLVDLSTGSYSCSITDANGCSFQSPVYTVTEPPLLSVQVDSISNVRCFGEKNGYVCVHAVGGAGAYEYNWSNGSTTPCLGAVFAGLYSLTVTDANGCTVEWLGVVSQPGSLQIEFTHTQPPLCNGAKDGQIELVMSGGQSPFHFIWTSGDTTALAKNLGVGSYKATITDASGCSLVSPAIALTAPQLLTITPDTIVNVSCRGGSNGLISVSVGGAVGNISTKWNNIPDDLTLTNAVAGQYILQVTDERSCSIKDTFVVTQPEAALTISLQNVKNALCAGEPTGSITVRASGGTAPYQYSWSNGAHTANLPSVAAGTYGLTVTDSKGCTADMAPVTVGEPPALVVSPVIHDIPCFGITTGDIQLSVSGGMSPYQFFWSHNKTSQNVFNLAAGPYSVTVLDATGCANVLTDLTVKDLNVDFVLEPVLVEPVSCGGMADGRVAVRVINGAPPFQFSWSPPVGLHANIQAPQDTAKNLSGGEYWVTVTDAAGCTTISTLFSVEEAPNLLLSITKIISNICKGDSTGKINSNISGGVPPYSYIWTNDATLDSVQNLKAGSYAVTATDSRGCTAASPPVQITEPAAALKIVLDQLTPDACGKQEGAIQLHLTGGSTPYHYLWDNMATSASLANLPAGNYQLTTTDNLGCTIVSPVYEILQLAPPLVLLDTAIQDVLCRGDSTGAINPSVGGGTPGYNFAWSNGAITPSISNIPAGNYTLTLSDSKGCFDLWNFSVKQPATALIVTSATDSLSNGWTITLSPGGGLPGYDIQWDSKTGNQTGPVASGLETGYYSVTVIDQNGCSKILGIIAGTSGTSALPDAGWHILLAPNPVGSSATLAVELPAAGALRVRIFSETGQLLLEQSAPEKQSLHRMQLDLSALPAGYYIAMLHTEDGRFRSIPLIKL